MRIPSILVSCLALAVAPFSPAQSDNDRAADLIEKGEFLKAERLVEPLATAKRADARSLVQLAQVRIAQHRTAEAIKLIEKALKQNPANAEYYSLLGTAYGQRSTEVLDSSLSQQMRRAFERALKVDPNYVPALVGLVRFHFSAAAINGGDTKKGEETLARLAELDLAAAELERGTLAMFRQKKDEAVAHLHKAAELKPADFSTQSSVGIALYKLDEKNAARPYLEKALELNPSSSLVRDTLKKLDEPVATPAK